jgi:hypothetical protein
MKESDLTNIVYDTLMGNVGISDAHIGLNLNDVENQEVDSTNCKIILTIDGEDFEIRVNKFYSNKITKL